MASSLTSNQVLGIVLVVLGILILLGYLAGAIVLLGAIALVVYGILILLKKAKGATWVGVVCLVAGILLLAPRIPFIGDILGAATQIAILVIGVLILVVGIMKLAGK